MKKRILACMLAVMMIVSVCPDSALANEEGADADRLDSAACMCETRCTEAPAEEDCAVCAADHTACTAPEQEEDPALQDIRARIQELPTVDELEKMDGAQLEQVGGEIEDLYASLQDLTEEQKALLDMGPLEAAAQFFSQQSEPQADGDDGDSGEPEDETTFTVSTAGDLLEAIQEINGADGGKFIISLQDDIVLVGTRNLYYITKNEATLLGNGYTITYGDDTQSFSCLGSSGGVLNLGKKDGTEEENDLTITVNNKRDHANPILMIIGSGTINMYDGVTLTGNVDTSSDAGGVEIQNGTFNMYGGTISNCVSYYGTGGGVRVYGYRGKAVFNMHGGVIEENQALRTSYSSFAHGGGVLVMNTDAEFTMSGGTIQNNQASFYGGGICNYAGKVEITGGTVKGNESGAGDNRGRGYGGGICNYFGDMTVEDCVIEGNKALNGGGICAYGVNSSPDYPGEMKISKCLIQGNEAKNAGGVFAVSSKDVEISGCTINENRADDWGGGVYAYSSEVAIKENSKIKENTATVGGGLVMEESAVSVSDTSILENTAKGEGAMAGGVYFDNDGLSFSGKVIVQGNKLNGDGEALENNVYFMYGTDDDTGETVYQTVQITGLLTGSRIGVTEQGVMEGKAPSPAFTSGYVDANPGVHPKAYFTSDNPDYIVIYSEDQEEARLGKAVTVSYQWIGEAPDGVTPPEPEQIEKGAAYTAKKQEDTSGYHFDGWYTDEARTEKFRDGTPLDQSTVLYGRWLKKAVPVVPVAAAYKVERYKETLEGEYSLDTEELLSGTIGETVSAQEKAYDNYHVNSETSVLSGTVIEPVLEEDGGVKLLTLKVYYDLDTHTVSYDLDGGTGANGVNYDSVTVKHGAEIVVNGAPSKSGYSFKGWSDGTAVYQPGDKLTALGDVTLTAQYQKKGGGNGGSGSNGGSGGSDKLNTDDHYSYIIGYQDGTIRPYGAITRGEVATIFFRLLTDETRDEYWSQTNGYSDCSPDLWCNNAISTLSSMGIIDGYQDGTFRPYAKITRAQFAKIAVGFFETTREDYANLFTDVDIGAWYTGYVEAAAREGLIQGFEDGTFRPNTNITRAQACVIVNRALGRKPDADHLLSEKTMLTWPDNKPGDWFYADMQEATNSHDYTWLTVRGVAKAMESWTKKLEQRDWAAFEHAWSTAHSAPGGEVVK